MSAKVAVVGTKPVMEIMGHLHFFFSSVTLKVQPSSLRMSTFPVNLDAFLDKQQKVL